MPRDIGERFLGYPENDFSFLRVTVNWMRIDHDIQLAQAGPLRRQGAYRIPQAQCIKSRWPQVMCKPLTWSTPASIAFNASVNWAVAFSLFSTITLNAVSRNRKPVRV